MALVDQIFEQAKLGTATDPSANPFAGGLQMGLEQQRINQQGRELAIKVAQAPLQQTLLEQQAQKNALTIEQGLRAKQDDIEADKAFTGLQGPIFDKLNNGDLPGAINEYTKGGIQNPSILITDKYKALGVRLDAMQKEADIVKARADANAARMKAAGGAEFRSLPTAVKIDRLLQQAKSDLQQAQDPETGDPSLVPHFQDVVNSLERNKKLEEDKLKVQQDKVVNEADRNKAINARTAATNARTLELGNRLNRGDLALMNQKIKVIQDQPNSKMDFDAKMKAIDAIHAEFEAKTKTYSTPVGAPPSRAPTSPTATQTSNQFRLGGTYRKPDGRRYIYKGGDANDPGSWQEVP